VTKRNEIFDFYRSIYRCSNDATTRTKVIEHIDDSRIFLDYSIYLDDDVDTVIMHAWPSSEWVGVRGGVAVNGSVGAPGVHRGTAGPHSHNGWLAPCSRWQGASVALRGCAHVTLPLLTATNGVQQGQMVVCGHQGAGVRTGTAGSCGHHGWFTQSNRCWHGPVGPKGGDHVALPLLAITSAVRQGQMAVCGHCGWHGAERCCWLLWPLWVVHPRC